MIERYLIWAIALASFGCAEPAGVDLRLVPDPNVNSRAQVLDAVDSIVLVMDSPEGLYSPGSERTGSGGVRIEDADSDPTDLEVVTTIPVREDLPIIRIEKGSLPDVALDLRFLGVPPDGGSPTVTGRVQGVRLSRPIDELAVPFNLLPGLLPPRVTEVLPGDGSVLSGCDLTKIFVMFSRPIREASLEESIHLFPGSVDAIRLDPSGLTLELSVSGLTQADDVNYSLAIDSTVTGTDGQALDQVPSEAGPQAYSAEHSLTCGPAMGLPMIECGQSSGPLPPTCAFPGRLQCVDGFCVPVACELAQCLDGTVCDPVSEACVLDCRPWGDAFPCPEDRRRCDAATGACLAD